MRSINTNVIIENIASLLRPYSVEMSLVPESDRLFVLRRLQYELRHRLHTAHSLELVRQYRELDAAIETDLQVLENYNPREY